MLSYIKEVINMSIGRAVTYLREVYDMTQLELAERLGINKSTLSRIEAGTRGVKDDELIKIADFFDTSTDYLLGRTETQHLFVKRTGITGIGENMEMIRAYHRAPQHIRDIVDLALQPYSKKKLKIIKPDVTVEDLVKDGALVPLDKKEDDSP
jgi:transcriptional regulator with XRE-family HTH domain